MTLRKGRLIGLIIGIALLMIFAIKILPGLMFASAIPEPHSIELDKVTATKFISDIESYGKIFELDDCQRYTKRINGISVRMNEKENDNEYGTYYKLILKDESIDEKVFENFRKYLDESELRTYQKIEDYSLFVVDGFLDNIWGYLYLHSDRELGTEYFNVDHHSIKIIEDLGDNWYRIAGS
ncbi:hypothetical protein [Mariniflexile sp. HMF6888]|uniref:hypothetical protein n=1 Tax=Mariniflexile sp. HMF6888 TaxID=3373086 RepID=UPI0037BB33FF